MQLEQIPKSFPDNFASEENGGIARNAAAPTLPFATTQHRLAAVTFDATAARSPRLPILLLPHLLLPHAASCAAPSGVSERHSTLDVNDPYDFRFR